MNVNQQKVFQKILAQVDQLDTQIHLKLPAGQVSIQRQVEQIEAAEQQLKALKVKLLAKSPSALQPNSSRGNHLFLMQRIEKALWNAANFKHLAEEFFLDPEGVISLLQKTN